MPLSEILAVACKLSWTAAFTAFSAHGAGRGAGAGARALALEGFTTLFWRKAVINSKERCAKCFLSDPGAQASSQGISEAWGRQ